MKHVYAALVALTLAVGTLMVAALAAQTPAKYSTDPPAGWQVPRTKDGRPDLQGVWGNNSVTPMVRPRQWKDKAKLTDAEVDELKGFLARFVDQGGDAIFGNLVQLTLDAKDK